LTALSDCANIPFDDPFHDMIRRAYAQSMPLLWLGVLGLALAGFVAVASLFTGIFIPPEGDLTKPITFDAALGIYFLTIGLFVPLAGFSPRGLRRWLAWSVGLAIYAFTIETVQPLRGLDPRFSHYASIPGQIAGGVFGIVALGVLTLYVILASKLIARGTSGPQGLLLLSIRYASASAGLAFAAGICMMVVLGRKIGVAGNILPLHAAGFHALQAIPIVAILLERSKIPLTSARRSIHIAGLAWFGMCLAIAWQTVAGRPVVEVSIPMILAGIQMGVWAACALAALYLWRSSAAVEQPA